MDYYYNSKPFDFYRVYCFDECRFNVSLLKQHSGLEAVGFFHELTHFMFSNGCFRLDFSDVLTFDSRMRHLCTSIGVSKKVFLKHLESCILHKLIDGDMWQKCHIITSAYFEGVFNILNERRTEYRNKKNKAVMAPQINPQIPEYENPYRPDLTSEYIAMRLTGFGVGVSAKAKIMSNFSLEFIDNKLNICKLNIMKNNITNPGAYIAVAFENINNEQETE